jgi:hypothetical protein
MNHQEAYELIDGFAAGTLEAAEFAAVEQHLASGCADCLERLREASEVGAQLAGALSQHSAPDSVKQALLEKVAAAGPAASSKSDGSAGASGATGATGFPFAKTVSYLSVAAAVALFFWTLSLNKRIDTLTGELASSQTKIAQLQQDYTVQNDATELLSHPCTKLFDLVGVEPNPNSFANVVIHPDIDYAVLYVYRMPQPDPDKQYQLWLTMDGTKQSVGVFTVNEQGEAMMKLESLPNPTLIDSISVTI